MPQPSYPTAEDLGAWLDAAGFSETMIASLDLETAMAAGIRTFEEMTGRTFLAAEGTRTFDVPYSPLGIVDLIDDAVSVSGVSLFGTTQTLGEGFRLLPINAAARGRPYIQIQLPRAYFNQAISARGWGRISVTGLWGWGEMIPDDVWQAMLMMAGMGLFPQIAQFSAGGLESWKEADVSENYGSDPLGSLRTNWGGYLYGPESAKGQGGVVGIYKRVTV